MFDSILRSFASVGVRSRVMATGLALALAAAVAAAKDVQPGETLWQARSLRMSILNEPALTDVNADGEYELILTDIEGVAAALNAKTGRLLWRRRIDGGPTKVGLTPPLPGRFSAERGVDIVVGDFAGRLHLLSGATGESLATLSVNRLAPLPLTLVPGSGPNDMDTAIGVTDTGEIVAARFDRNEAGGKTIWTFDRASRINFPLSAARAMAGAPPLAVLGTPLARIHLLDPATGRSLPVSPNPEAPLYFITQGRRPVETPLAVGDLDGDGRREIVYGDGANYVVALESRQGGLATRWSTPQPFTGLRNVLLADILPEGGLEVIASQGGAFYALDSDGRIRLTETAARQISTDLALLSRPRDGGGRQVEIAFADVANSVHIYQIDVSDDGLLKAVRTLQADLPHRPGPTLLLADVDDDRQAELIGTRGDGGEAFCLETGRPFPEGSSPWIGPGGQPHRTQWADPAYYERWEGQRAAVRMLIDRVVADAQRKYDEGEWEAAADGARRALSIDGRHEQARRLLRSSTVGRHLITLLLTALAALVALGLLAYQTFAFVTRRRALARAEQLADTDQADEAYNIYRRYFVKRPGRRAIRNRLARLMVDMKRYDKDALPALETAAAEQPADASLQIALAEAYMENELTAEEAIAACERARRDFEPRWRMEAFLGRAYAAQDKTDAAIDRFEDAIKLGPPDERICEELARLYMKSDRRSGMAAPIFETALREHPDDVELLEAACLSFIDARRADDTAIAAYERLIEIKPDHRPTIVQLGNVALAAGNNERGLELADRILALDADDPQGLALQANILVSMGREDDEAVGVIERATQANPTDRGLVRALAHAYLHQQREDKQAVALYKRARELSPEDVALNRAVAVAAGREGDRELQILALEKLIELGQEKRELLVALGKAYRDEGVAAPKALRAYEVAREAMPEDLEICRLLGEVYDRLDRLDAAVVATIEPLRKAERATPALLKRLARAYQAGEMHEDALRLLEELTRAAPGDPDLKRMYAEASLMTNDLESAVQEYEQILAAHPNDREALANCALAYSRLQRMDRDALGLYRRALSACPDDPRVLRVVSRVHAAQGNIPEALKAERKVMAVDTSLRPQVIEDCREFAKRHGDVPDLRLFLAQCLILEGRFQEAVEELQRAVEISPERADVVLKAYEQIISRDQQNVRAQLGAGRLCRKRGDLRPARRFLEAAYLVMPHSADVQSELIELYETLLKQSDGVEMRFKLGEVYLRAGRQDEAIGCFQRCGQDFRFETQATIMLAKAFIAKDMYDIAFNELKKLPIEGEIKDILYDLAVKFQEKGDLVGAKNAYRLLFAADIGFRDVKDKFELLAGSTSDPMVFEKTAIVNDLSANARRRYDLIEELGRGAMGIVYRADDRELDETVALKILPDNLSNNPEAVARFRAEARSARHLSHPNICRIHDIGEEMGRKYISMELVRGTDLKRIIRSRKLELSEALEIAATIADALAAAHGSGIVHRDIKPANILISEEGVVKVTDFGIAKAMESEDATQAGAVLGTPLYMSPEQILSKPIDHRVDIYSLGIMLYEMVAGRPPFTKDNLAQQHLNTRPATVVGVPDDVMKIIMTCLEKEPDQRFASAADLRDALSEARARIPG